MIRIGTAGWSIPRQHAERFPPGPSALSQYAAALPAVEVNSSFWRRHRVATWARWAATVPAEFRFAVKVPRALTHERGLKNAGAPLDELLADVAPLGDKLGPLLVQLPPSLELDVKAARAFFGLLRSRRRGAVALEPRHASWFGERADDLLIEHRIARVAADPPRAAGRLEPGGDGLLAYFRLHGSPRMYRTPYGPERLAALAAQLRVLEVSETWVFFDNTASGAAAGDALDLRMLIP